MRLRAPIQYYGGKGNMISRILPLFPPHHLYCEPFGGAASLLFAKTPASVEVYNDLNQQVVNLFRCLQDKAKFEALQHRLRHTLYSRAEFARAIEIDRNEQADDLDRAWAVFVLHNQGFGGKPPPLIPANWGRVFTSTRGMAQCNSAWIMRLSMLPDWHRRLLMVQIDCREALEVIRYWDRPDTLFYVDPPYILNTRRGGKAYPHEMTDAQHRELVDLIQQVCGKVILSAYNHPIYDVLESAGWRKITYQNVLPFGSQNAGFGVAGGWKRN